MKKVAAFVGALALLATSAASMGCAWVLFDEPTTSKSFND